MTLRLVGALGIVLASGGLAQAQAPAPQAPPPPGEAPLAPVNVGPDSVLPARDALCAESNRPPQILRVWPDRYAREEIVVAIGRTMSMTLEVNDPEGVPVRIFVIGLPKSASFDEALRTLTFTPTAAQENVYPIRFVVSDGCREMSRSARLVVRKNTPPSFRGVERKVHVGAFTQIGLQAGDAESDQLSYVLENKPRGAEFDANSGVLSWQPDEAQVGEHVLHVTASDGEKTARAKFTITVEELPRAREQWKSFLLPGAAFAAYRPRARDWGTFQGLALELLLAAWIHRNENRGPSHGRVYVSAELLDSSRDRVPILFGYAVGFSLSLERNPSRSWLIPHYGLDIGGVIQNDLGSPLQATPYLGMHFYSNPNLFVNGRVGYRLVPRDIERLAGWHASLGASVSIW